MTREHGRVACATLVKTMAASDDHLVIQDYESGSTIFMDCSAADGAGTIALPLPAVGLSYRIIASADFAAQTIVMSSWSNAATRAAVNTIFYGVLMDDAANSLVGTTALTFVSDKIEKGDVIDLVSDGTGWHVICHCTQAGSITVA
jgi:hypothetical protein